MHNCTVRRSRTEIGQEMVVRKFETSGEAQAARARWIWQILSGYVAFGGRDPYAEHLPPGVMSYRYLREIMGYDHGAEKTLGGPLGYIMRYCEANQLPFLNCIVVRKDRGIAGWEQMFQDQEAHLREQKRVIEFKYQWLNMRAPTTSDFRKIGPYEPE